MNRFLVTVSLCLASVALGAEFFNDVTGRVQPCMDVNEFNDPVCWKNMLWAKSIGLHRDSWWYPMGATTLVDFQCALALKGVITGVNHSGPSWNCTEVPCAYVSPGFSWLGGTPDQADTKMCRHAPMTVITTTMATMPATTTTSTTTTTEAPASIPVWGWALITAALCSALVAAALLFWMKQKKPAPKRQKRALDVERPPPAPAPKPQPTIVEPLPMYRPLPTPQPVYSVSQPVATYAAPQPVATYAAPAPQGVTFVQAAPTMSTLVASPQMLASPRALASPQARPVYQQGQQQGPSFVAQPMFHLE